MEPANLNSRPPDEDRLADLLKSGSPDLPDAGFSQRVLAALPPPRRRLLPWSSLLWAGAAAALALVIVQGMGGSVLNADIGAWTSQAGAALERLLADPWSAGALLVAAAALALAWTEEAYR